MAKQIEHIQSQRFHYSMPMEMALWEFYGINRRSHGMASAFGNVTYFKKECRNILRKIKKRVNDVVTNDELLLEALVHDVDILDSDIKALSKSTYTEIDVIAGLLRMVAHLLGWAYFEGEFFRTPIYYQTEQQRDNSLQKGERLKTPCEIPYQKRRIVLQLRNEGVSYKEIAFILKVSEADVKLLEKAKHLDEWREDYLRQYTMDKRRLPHSPPTE